MVNILRDSRERVARERVCVCERGREREGVRMKKAKSIEKIERKELILAIMRVSVKEKEWRESR